MSFIQMTKTTNMYIAVHCTNVYLIFYMQSWTH